ncbi:acyl-CoA dehydrogenase family protein [Terriglobus aquaticus]|uniref:Acyl-CoA dehydrogenase n=1 Tax=Terriglobus aquaticus TaxID=940139 RepID=A0ABW9KMV4_9BACT|nr:hypothetical protein [Terriglobus aquaticus]
MCDRSLPHLGGGETPQRHAVLFDIGEEDLSLAKIAEAHFDAQAILDEARLSPEDGAIYAVWASEVPGQGLELLRGIGSADCITGGKPFCSGATLVDRALVTVAHPEPLLVEVDLRRARGTVDWDLSQWSTEAFRLTCTGAVRFQQTSVERVVGAAGFYLDRPGFWHGACGPAACWAGGAAGLLHFARQSKRNDAHTVAHRAAMEANVWTMRTLLTQAGVEIDQAPGDRGAAHVRALRLRHMVEQLADDTLQRFSRAYGPHPLAMDPAMSRRCAELNLFLRQCHGERDLEALGRAEAELQAARA